MIQILRSLPWPGWLKRFFESVPVAMIGLYFLGTRLLIFFLGAISAQVIQPGQYGHNDSLIDLFNRWDVGWYLHIVRHGYSYHVDAQSSVAFFPLYPLLVYLGSFVFGDPRISGYVISNLSLFAACLVLWKLVERDYGSKVVADKAVLFLLLGPVSFFFSTIYTESLFLFFFVLVAYFATGRRWLIAGLCAYFLTLSRSVGILVVILLTMEFVMLLLSLSRVDKSRAAVLAYLRGNGISFLVSLFLAVAGLATYCFYLWYKFDEPLAFQKTQIFWSRHFIAPWAFLRYDSMPHVPFYTAWFDAAIFAAFTLVALGLFFRIRVSHSMISAALVTFYLSTNSMDALPRLLSVIFPFYITLGLVATRWPRLEPLLLAASAMLLMLSTILFVNGYFFT